MGCPEKTNARTTEQDSLRRTPATFASECYSLLILGLLLVLVALGCSGCLQRPSAAARPFTAMVVIVDPSPSMVGDARCEEVAARVRRMLAAPGVKRLDVLALATGEGGTGLEPIILVPWTRWQPAGDLYEQPGRAAAARDAWVESIRAACHRAIRPTNTSPIFAAIKRGAESIVAHCAESEHQRERCDRRALFVHSDMRENGERSIRERLIARTQGRTASRSRPMPRIDVNGLELAICGVANTRLGAGEAYIDPAVLSSVWSEVLGPGMPAFDAACPADPAPPSSGASGGGR